LNGHSSGTDENGAGGGSARAPQSTLERINQFATLQSGRPVKREKFQRWRYCAEERICVSSLCISPKAFSHGLTGNTKRGFLFVSDSWAATRRRCALYVRRRGRALREQSAGNSRSTPMKGRTGLVALAIMFMTVVAHATSLTVTDIKVAQRYPWNGLVDITYTVNCDDATKDVWVYPVGYDADNDKTVAMMPAHLTGDGVGKAVKSGTHRMTWDMATAMGANYNRAAFSVKMHAFCDAAPYMVIDLSSGSESEKYDVSYLAEEPEGGWGEEYLTTKMVFRLILPGRSYDCRLYNGSASGSSEDPVENVATVVDSPYYFAVYPMTQQQWCLIAGGSTTTPTYWMSRVSHNDLKGEVLGSKWPTHQQVDANSVCGRMRLRTGMTVDIPTYAQWYRAASADFMHTSIVNPNAWGIGFYGRRAGGNTGDTLNGEWGRDRFDYKASSSISEFAVLLGRYRGTTPYNHTTDLTYAPYLSGWASDYGSKLSKNGYSGYFGARLVVCPVSK